MNLIWNGVFRIARAFVSDDELMFEVQTIFCDTALWKNVIVERLLVFSVVRLRFNCFRILLMDSYIKCLAELEIAKSSFSTWICERITCIENNFSCRATEAFLFSNVIYIYGHEIFRRFRSNKTVFFEVNLGRNFLEKKLFDIARWTCKCSQIW